MDGRSWTSHNNDLLPGLTELHSHHRLLLTGAPIKQKLHELLSLNAFTTPEIFEAIEELVPMYPENSSRSLVEYDMVRIGWEGAWPCPWGESRGVGGSRWGCSERACVAVRKIVWDLLAFDYTRAPLPLSSWRIRSGRTKSE